MQLSLRTLLAFADDIYDPQSRQQVMQHIKEHPTAETALQKVLDVVRCDTLAVPGKEFDPNLVAAYLDYLLSDDEVYRFEMLACQSDIYLTEVASVHHLLNVVFGRPASISSEIRRQLYRIPMKKSPSVSQEFTSRHNPREGESSFYGRYEGRHLPERPHLNELLESYKKKTHTQIWKIGLSCVLLFIAVFYLQMLYEPSTSEPTSPKSTAVSVATLTPKVDNTDYFQENRNWANSSFPPSLPEMGASMPMSDPMSELLTSENSDAEVLQKVESPAAYISQAQPLSSDNSDIFYPSQYILPQSPYESFYESLGTAQNPSPLNHFSDVDSHYTSLHFTPDQTIVPQDLHIYEKPLMNGAGDLQKEGVPHDVAMEIRYDSYVPTSPESDILPDVVFSTPDAYRGSLMQISSVSQVSPAPLIQQNNISLDETVPKSANKMDVKYFGDVPNIDDIINQPLPPLIPNHEKKKPHEDSKEPEISLENHTNRAITPVNFQKQNAIFSERMKITTLQLMENHLTFVARDENSLWERAIDEKSLSGEFLLVPAPFTASIHAGNGVNLTITGDTRLNVLTESAGIHFDYGHITLEVDQDAIFPVSYTIKTPQGNGTLTFFSPKTKVHLTSLDQESKEYAPQLLIFPGEEDSVIWTPETADLQLKIDTNSKVLFGMEEIIVPLAKDFDEKSITATSNFMDEDLKKTGLELYSRVVFGTTLESVLEELISDPSENVMVLGCRWCAELGRIDIPFQFLSMDDISPTVHKQLNDYLSEVKLRDPETVSKLERAEKSILEP